MEASFPVVEEGLLKQLNLLYPEKCPDPGESLEAIWYKSGQRSVVNFLIEQHKRQNETIR